MANVRVALRVRPLSKRETKEGGRIIVEVDGKIAKIRNLKVDSRPDSFGDSREKIVAFGFDYCYWSVNPEDPHYASQDVVFQDLGTKVLSGAVRGYNICLFAYGQTGSGKTYTMLGTPASVGLTPRICEGLFSTEEDCPPQQSSCRVKVSFLEIYNERVRDLLKQSDQRKPYTLRVREHPEMGPYVQGLSQHVVTNYEQVIQLLEEGIANRMTAATHVHEASSRSHAIFTIHYSQATMENNFPSETASKINLVDLAGSERADPSYCKDRITEGANINKSLVTLGIVISALAQNSQVSSGCQSLSSAASDGVDSGVPSSGSSSGGGPPRRQSYIPYRDSVLTWLLKDSLGGNSQTIMVATVSPAHTCYSETMSTLRYAANAKNIVNKPQVNEDANIKLIRELREEIGRLRAMLLSFELRNFNSPVEEKDESLKELVLQNELKIDQLTQDWHQKWGEWKALVEHYRVDINRRRAGVVIDSSLPHLMTLEDDVLSTGVVLYHLKEGITKIGRIDSEQEQDIVLQGQWIERDHCTITSACGVVILRPTRGARCTVNGREVTASCRLTQGAVITLGKAQTFRFNHPAEAAALRQRRQVGEPVGGGSSLEWLDLDGDVTAARCGCSPLLCRGRSLCGRGAPQELREEDHQPPRTGTPGPSAQPPQQRPPGQGEAQQGLGWPVRVDQLQGEPWRLAGLQTRPRQDHVAPPEPEASALSNAGPETEPETRSSLLVRTGQRTERRRQRPRRHSVRAAGRSSRRTRLWLQLGGVFRKQRLLASQESLEQLQASCWPWDDQSWASSLQGPGTGTMVRGGEQSSDSSTSRSSLSLRALCIQYLRQLGRYSLRGSPGGSWASVFLKLDSSTSSPSIPDPPHQISEKFSSKEPQAAYYSPGPRALSRNVLRSAGEGQLCTVTVALARKRSPDPAACLAVSSECTSVWEMEKRRGRQPCQTVSQSSASSCPSTQQLTPPNEPLALGPHSQTRRAQELIDSGLSPAGRRVNGQLGVHTTTKAAPGRSSHPAGLRQAGRHGKAARALWKHPELPSPSTVSKREQVAPTTGLSPKSSHLPHDCPLKGRHSEGDRDPVTSPTVRCPAVDPGGGRGDGDLSDAGSSYSVDSLCCVCNQELTALPRPEASQETEQDLPRPENEESDDDGQISEDSLAEKRRWSPQGSPRGRYIPGFPSQLRTRARVLARGCTTSSDCGRETPAPRSFSLENLIDTEEELRAGPQEAPPAGLSDEMPTETFWHPQTSGLPCGQPLAQEAILELGLISHRTEVRLDAILPKNHSFHLQPQPGSKQPTSEVAVNSWAQASALQVVPPPRGSPRVSPDSWFSCDSKMDSSSSPEIAGVLGPSPEVPGCQPRSWKRPGHWRTMDEPKPPGVETGLPNSASMSQEGAESFCSVRAAYTIPSCVMSGLSFCRRHSLCQPGAEGSAEARGIPGLAWQDSCKAANNAGTSGVLMPPVSPFPPMREWAALQQKDLLEQSHPVSGGVGGPRPAFSSPKKDNASLTPTSGKRPSLVPDGPAVPSGLDFCNFPTRPSRIQHLRAEKEAHSLSGTLEGTSGFLTASHKEVSGKDACPAAGAPAASGSAKAWMVVAETERANQGAQTQGAQDGRRPWFLGKPEPIESSDRSSSPRNSGHSKVIVASGKGFWAQGRPPPHSAGQVQQESWAAPWGRTGTDTSTASLLSHPGVHPGPWDPDSSSLQPPSLETFYLTRSRDALTETALEIPACRERRVVAPPAQEAWGFGCDEQALHRPSADTHRPLLPQHPHLNTASSTWARGGKCPGNADSAGCASDYSLLAPNKRFPAPAGESKSPIGTSKTHGLPEVQTGGLATRQSSCRIFPHSSELQKGPLTQTSGEKERSPGGAALWTQPSDAATRSPSPGRSGFIYKTFDFDRDQGLHGALSASTESRPAHSRVGSPRVTWEDCPAAGDDGKPESGLPGKAQQSEGEGGPRGAESVYERLRRLPCSDSSLSHGKDSGRSPDVSSLKAAASGKKQPLPDFEEMARLIRSVRQLENDVLEMEHKQEQLFSASRALASSSEASAPAGQRRQEVADLLHILSSSQSHLSFKVPSSPHKQSVDATPRGRDAREVEFLSSTEHEPWDPKTTLSPARPRDCGPGAACIRERPQPAQLDTEVPSSDYGGTEATFRSFPRTATTACRTEVLARAEPPRSWPQRSEKEKEQAQAATSPMGQPRGLGRPRELEPANASKEGKAAGCTGGSKQEEPQGLGGATAGTKRGRRMRKGRQTVSPAPSLPPQGPRHSQHPSPLPSLPDSSTASPRDLSSTSPSVSPRRLRSYLHASDTFSSLSSDDFALATAAPRAPGSPSVAGTGHQAAQIGAPGPHTDGGSGSSVPHTAEAGALTTALLGAQGWSAQEPERRVPASSSTPGPGGGLRTVCPGPWSRVGSAGAEAKTLTQRQSNPSQPAPRTQHPQEKSDRGGEAVGLGPAAAAAVAAPALPGFPQPERVVQRESRSPAVLGESQQLQAPGKQPCGTLLPYYEKLLELEYSLGIPSRPLCPPVDGAGRARHEGDVQGHHRAALLVDRVSADDSPPPLAAPATQTRPGPPSHTASCAGPALDRRCCRREPSDLAGAAVEGRRTMIPEGGEAPSASPGAVPQDRSPSLAALETTVGSGASHTTQPGLPAPDATWAGPDMTPEPLEPTTLEQLGDGFGDRWKPPGVSPTTSRAPARPQAGSSSAAPRGLEPAAEGSGNAPSGLPDQPCPAAGPRDSSVLALQAKLAAKLKKPSSPQADSAWEEEEQQSEQAAGGSGQGAAGPRENSPETCRVGDAGRETAAAARPPVPPTCPSCSRDAAAGPWAWSSEPRAPAQHRHSLPVVAICHSPAHPGASFEPHFSVVSGSLSLQKLNLATEPPPPTLQYTQDPSRLWNPQLEKPSEKSGAGREAVCEASHWSLPAAGPPYPASALLSCMPTPEFQARWPAGASEQAQQATPDGGGEQAGQEAGPVAACREVLYLGSCNLPPCELHWCPQEPARIGWKQYVFGSAPDFSQNQSHQGAMSASMDRCASEEAGQGSAPRARSLLDMCSSIGNSRASQESWDRSACTPLPSCPGGAASTKGTDGKGQLLGTAREAGSAMGPTQESALLCLSLEASCMARAGQCTLEQGTQTDCEAVSAPVAGSAVSWDSVHSLSLHLSQLLHSTSELIESLSQPGVAEKEPDARREGPQESLPALRMDGCTQTTVDEGTQTDPAQPPLRPLTPEADPWVRVSLEVLDSDSSTPSQEQGCASETQQWGEAEERAGKRPAPPDLQGERPHCRPLSPPRAAFDMAFRQAPFGPDLLSLSPPASAASLTPSSQTDKLLCLAVSSLGFGPCTHDVEDPAGAVLVDRASSPILTLSSSTPRLRVPAAALPPSSLPAHSPEDPESPVPGPGPPLAGPRPLSGEFPNAEELEGCLRTLCEVTGPSPGSPEQGPKLQEHFKGELQHLLPLGPGLAQGSVPEDAAAQECDPPSSVAVGRSQCPMEDGGETSAPPAAPQPTPGPSSLQGPPHHGPGTASELTQISGLPQSNPPPEGQLQLCPSPQMTCDPEPPDLRDLPVHNKFSHWCGVQDGALETDVQGGCDPRSWGQSGQRPPQPGDRLRRAPERTPELIPLQVGAQSPPLSVELAEARLHHGFGETDALLRLLQSGTGEALAAEEPPDPPQEPRSTWQTVMSHPQREQPKQPPNLCWPHSLSPHKEPHRDLPARGLDLPSRRREYLQQLRKDVVETTRSPGQALKPTLPPSGMELLLQEYEQARAAAKQEMTQARARLQERTEQEKLRIRRQIISQLRREEEKLHLLTTSSSLCTSSNASFTSGLTSGYNSSAAVPGQLLSPLSTGDTNLPDSRDSWRGDTRGWSAARSSNRNWLGTPWKSVASGNRTFPGSSYSPFSLSSAGSHFSSSYQDLAKHIVDLSLADVMAACSNSLHNLFSRHEAAGWKYQGQEQEVQLYHKVFSSTRHGFLGAGLVLQPMSHVWAAVSDPTLWPLYHKPIETVRLHQRVTKSINLVYLVCNTTMCALKQPRDFCCVCVEAKEGHLSIMAGQSVYDPSMPRPSREMVRGEILPSAWILQPLTRNGKEITRVIYLAQVELGAPGFPPQLLSSFTRQQPLIIAKLASFLGS